jgi:hypothetical protein
MNKMIKTSKELDLLLTKEILTKRYLFELCTFADIAKEFSCDKSSVQTRLKKHNIPFQNNYLLKKESILTKEFLEKEYITNNRSLQDIEKEVGYTGEDIRKYLIKFGIPVRSLGTFKKGYTPSKEQKIKQSLAKKGKIPWIKGRTLSKEHKNKIGVAITGRPCLDETKAKMRESWKKNPQRLEKFLKIVCDKEPNKFETRCLNFLDSQYPKMFKFTGNGSCIVNWRSADAFSKELGVICLFNGLYWHLTLKGLEATEENKRLQEQIEAEPFLKAGYAVWFIWEKDESKVIKYINPQVNETLNSKDTLQDLQKLANEKVDNQAVTIMREYHAND